MGEVDTRSLSRRGDDGMGIAAEVEGQSEMVAATATVSL